ncbi:molybdopterin-dependent oxidoreductase [Pseudonocardia eucalypti]|uniref:Molybdopterin-dependent oxidoreductase n=1 Tax=Pseudonocardia eucalypti TaxID=648755 RepID=A0ABP9PN05_9PSEU|nr:formate dehydrogenase [Pseudonocardia eucalypti]
MPEEKLTFCRICEPLCGMIATVENGKLLGLRPDKQDPHSKGFHCTKGVAMEQIVNDPDRLTVPMRRVGGPGEFEPTTWEQALTDIAGRLGRLRAERGPSSLAIHEGNPPYFSYSAVFWAKGFQKALGTPWFYGINSEDGASRVAAYKILYGHCAHMAIPDIRRTEALLMLGANPWVSKGSFLHDPRIREHLTGITERGGRVFVVDPRRTQTAKTFEHVAINAGTDAWFLLSVLHVLIGEGLYDQAFVDRWTSGFDQWRTHVAAFSPEATQPRTGVAPETVREVARAIGRARAAVVYGRTGTCTTRFGTFTNVLQDFVNIITGNLQRPGGWVWAWSPVEIGPMSETMKLATYGSVRTRVDGLPDSFGFLPSSALATEILTPGEGQIRGMVMIGSNCVVTGPSGERLIKALGTLDTFVAIDLYMNETNKYADYLLPATTMYEREDIPLQFANRYVRPSIRVTEAVADAPGQCRQEWEILDDIAARMGLGGAYSYGIQRQLAKIGIRLRPRQLADLILRTGKGGDWFGLRRRGWSWRKLAERAPRGVVFHEYLPLAPLRKMIKTEGKKIPMTDPRILDELERLRSENAGPSVEEFPLRMIGLREMNSHNSWMHNSRRLMPDRRHQAFLINPVDAARAGLADGDDARITSRASSIQLVAAVSDEMIPGTIAVPHGWGHNGGWRRANAAGGATSNFLADEVEALSASTVLNGIPVRVTAVVARHDRLEREAPATAPA